MFPYVPEWIAHARAIDMGPPMEEIAAAHGGEEFCNISLNENPCGPSPRAADALLAAASGVHRYPHDAGLYLRRDIAEREGLDDAQVVLGNGSSELLELLCRVFIQPGGEAVMAERSFMLYARLTALAGGRPRRVPLKEERHDLAALAAAVGPETRLVFVNNPNNPTGTIISRRAWEEFLAAVPEGVPVVLDEAYLEYCTEGDTPRSTDYLREDARVVGLRTFSKIYGLAGLRVGYALAHRDVTALINRVRPVFGVGLLPQAAARAALADREHVERCRRNNEEGKTYLYGEFERLGLAYTPTQGNFIQAHLGRDGAAVTRALLTRGVLVSTLAAYGLPDSLRPTIGLPGENRRFIAALAEALAEVQ